MRRSSPMVQKCYEHDFFDCALQEDCDWDSKADKCVSKPEKKSLKSSMRRRSSPRRSKSPSKKRTQFKSTPEVILRKSLDSNDRKEKLLISKHADDMKEKHEAYDEESNIRKDCVNYFLTRFNVWDDEDLEGKDAKFKEVGKICLKAYFTDKKPSAADVKKVNKYLDEWEKKNPEPKKKTIKQINKDWFPTRK